MKVTVKKFSRMVNAVGKLLEHRNVGLESLKVLKRNVYVVASEELQSDWEALTCLTEEEYDMIVEILEGDG